MSRGKRIQLQGDDAARFTLATEGISGVDIAQIVRNAKRSARRRSSELLASDILSQPRTSTNSQPTIGARLPFMKQGMPWLPWRSVMGNS